ncbi:hypothetical protein LUZ60_016623 [Juncus effusus]|nr:hypothetical protein LUZ60_016623 [Juncus effusus]
MQTLNDGNATSHQGPDGLNGEFYKTFWPLVREELFALIKNLRISPGLGDFSTLISSVQKIISKFLANRLKRVICQLVLPNQLGFVEDGEIADCFIYMLETILEVRGFGGLWIRWIQNCVLRGSAKVLLNGSPGKNVHLRGGVRQGGPLSPHLFILAIDTLARIVEELASLKFIEKPINVSIFYANDSLLFLKPVPLQARKIKFILDSFAQDSSLCINYLARTRLSNGDLPFRYLGYPLSPKIQNREVFHIVIEKFQRRLEGWQSELLSIGGRVILINSVLSSLPVYLFTAFKFLKWVLKEMERIRQKFLWKGSKEQGFNLVS